MKNKSSVKKEESIKKKRKPEGVWVSLVVLFEMHANASDYIWELRVDFNGNLDITTATQGVKIHRMFRVFFPTAPL